MSYACAWAFFNNLASSSRRCCRTVRQILQFSATYSYAKRFIEKHINVHISTKCRGARPSQSRRLYDGEESSKSGEAEGEPK